MTGVRGELANGLKYSKLKNLQQGMWFNEAYLENAKQSRVLHLNPTNPNSVSAT